MSDSPYQTETRALPIVELPAVLRNALVTLAERKKLPLIEAKAWLTHRENGASKTLVGRLLRRRANHADPDAWQEMAFILHATHLFFAKNSASVPSRVEIFSAPLVEVTFTPGADGFDVGGHFMPLGSGPAAEECLRATKAAIELARAPAA